MIVQTLSTLISIKTRVYGPIESEDPIVVDGVVEGEVRSARTITVGEQGRVHGQIIGCDVIIAGTHTENVYGHETIRLLATAKVTADLHAPRIAIDSGAEFEGRVQMKRVEPATRNPQGRSAVAAASASAPAQPPSIEPGRPTAAPRSSTAGATPSRSPTASAAPTPSRAAAQTSATPAAHTSPASAPQTSPATAPQASTAPAAQTSATPPRASAIAATSSGPLRSRPTLAAPMPPPRTEGGPPALPSLPTLGKVRMRRIANEKPKTPRIGRTR